MTLHLEPKDLRLGNLVITNNGIKQLTSQMLKDYVTWSKKEFKLKPIILNKDWLRLYGFIQKGKIWTFGELDLVEDEDGIYSFDESRIYVDIIYLHQLQNLFYYISGGEELKQIGRILVDDNLNLLEM